MASAVASVGRAHDAREAGRTRRQPPREVADGDLESATDGTAEPATALEDLAMLVRAG